MERRKAIKTAAAASLTLLAGAAGIALNSGIVGAEPDGNVGQLSPTATTVMPAPPVAPTPRITTTTAAPVTTSSASGVRGEDDDRYEDDDDDGYEDDDRGDDRDDDRGGERRYEGADDDD